jgi:LPS sulfotransferase NodH
MRFVLIAQPRTGTTVFGNLINKNRSVFMYREAFHPKLFSWGWYTYLQQVLQEKPEALVPTNWSEHVTPYLNGLYEAKEARNKLVVGIDIKVTQAELLYRLPKSIRDCGAKVLHVRRKNTLAAIVSWRIMTERIRQQGRRAHGADTPEARSVRLNVDWLKLRIAQFETQDELVKFTYRGEPYLEIFYEEFIGVAQWKAHWPVLSEFFGIPFKIAFLPRLQKQNPPNLADMITNAEEVRKAFPKFFEPEYSVS